MSKARYPSPDADELGEERKIDSRRTQTLKQFIIAQAVEIQPKRDKLSETLRRSDALVFPQDGAEKPEVPFLPLFVLFTLSMYGLETYLDIRQHRCLRAKSPPSTLLEVLRIVDSENKGLNAVSKVRWLKHKS